jgi:predicted Zn-dependent protease with MMP-like domain
VWSEASVVHTSALKDIPSVLALVEEEVVDLLLHRDAEQVVEGAEVLRGELLLGSYSGMLEKL